MTLLASNGAKVAIAALMKSLLDGGEIRVFSGPRPAGPDSAETGTLLGTVRTDIDGALVYVNDGAYLLKPTAAIWTLAAIADGTAAWFRIVANGASHGVSYSEVRFDGDVSADPDSGAEMILPSTAVVDGSEYPLDSFFYTIPPIFGA